MSVLYVELRKKYVLEVYTEIQNVFFLCFPIEFVNRSKVKNISATYGRVILFLIVTLKLTIKSRRRNTFPSHYIPIPYRNYEGLLHIVEVDHKK